MLNEQTRAAVLRAADFFAANPDKRIIKQLAEDTLSCPVDPTDPRATCWCALGRIAFELGVNPDANYTELETLGLDTIKIFNRNDHPAVTNDQVVDMLKELASNA